MAVSFMCLDATREGWNLSDPTGDSTRPHATSQKSATHREIKKRGRGTLLDTLALRVMLPVNPVPLII